MHLKRFILIAICCACLTPAAWAAPMINDPLNDVYPPGGPAGAGSPDIIGYSGDLNGNATTIVFSVTFAGAISPPSAMAANSIFGFIDLDTDKDSTTGGFAPWGAPQPGGNSWINFAVANLFLDNPPIALGDEFFVDLGSEAGNPGLVNIVSAFTNLPVAAVPISFTSTGFSFSVPLATIGSPANPFINYGLYVGNVNDFSGDRAPNGAQPAVVTPEPTSVALFALTVVGAAGYCWRRRRGVA